MQKLLKLLYSLETFWSSQERLYCTANIESRSQCPTHFISPKPQSPLLWTQLSFIKGHECSLASWMLRCLMYQTTLKMSRYKTQLVVAETNQRTFIIILCGSCDCGSCEFFNYFINLVIFVYIYFINVLVESWISSSNFEYVNKKMLQNKQEHNHTVTTYKHLMQI